MFIENKMQCYVIRQNRLQYGFAGVIMSICGRELTPAKSIKEETIMKRRTRKLTGLLVAAVTAVSALTAGSSALTLCIGGKCFELSLPSSCTRVVQITPDCLRSGNCGTTQNAASPICIGSNCGTTQNTATPGCVGINCGTPAQTVTAPAVPTGGDAAASTEVADVLALVNSERAAAGLSALTLDSKLCALADIRAKEIVMSFSHTRPNGTSCFTVFKENGVSYRYAGENLAYGQTSAKSVMNGWMNSSGHRANILGKNFGKIGISCYIANGRKYWVQLFTN